MGRRTRAFILPIIIALIAIVPVKAHPPYNGPAHFTLDEQITAGQMVHGGFGVLIALGLRIGEDAMARLGAGRRELDVTYYDGLRTPCPCILDGLMIGVSASPGQKTLRMGDRPAGAELFAEILIRHINSGQQLRYCLADKHVRPVLDLQNVREARGRYEALKALPDESLFRLAPPGDMCPSAP